MNACLAGLYNNSYFLFSSISLSLFQKPILLFHSRQSDWNNILRPTNPPKSTVT